jgi:hypothetical protein
VGLLKNGNFLNLKSIKINNKEYCVTNTCTFDSIFQLICSSYVNSDVYADFVNLNSTNLFFELISNAIRDGINSQIYKKRANILLNFISKSIDEMSDELIILNAACTAKFLIQKIFETYPTYKEGNECPQCGNQIVKNSTTFTANLPAGNIYFMLDVIENVFGTERKCK